MISVGSIQRIFKNLVFSFQILICLPVVGFSQVLEVGSSGFSTYYPSNASYSTPLGAFGTSGCMDGTVSYSESRFLIGSLAGANMGNKAMSECADMAIKFDKTLGSIASQNRAASEDLIFLLVRYKENFDKICKSELAAFQPGWSSDVLQLICDDMTNSVLKTHSVLPKKWPAMALPARGFSPAMRAALKERVGSSGDSSLSSLFKRLGQTKN